MAFIKFELALDFEDCAKSNVKSVICDLYFVLCRYWIVLS